MRRCYDVRSLGDSHDLHESLSGWIWLATANLWANARKSAESQTQRNSCQCSCSCVSDGATPISEGGVVSAPGSANSRSTAMRNAASETRVLNKQGTTPLYFMKYSGGLPPCFSGDWTSKTSCAQNQSSYWVRGKPDNPRCCGKAFLKRSQSICWSRIPLPSWPRTQRSQAAKT